MSSVINEARVEEIDDGESEEAMRSRRMAEYSPAALAAAVLVDRIFVLHTRFQQGLAMMDRIFQIAPEVTMPHGGCLIGPTGSGKSALFRYFRESLPRSSLFAFGYGVVGVRALARPTSGQLIASLLRAYRYPFRYGGGGTLYSKRDVLFDLMRQKKTRLVFLDEAHRLLNQIKKPESAAHEPEATQFTRDMMDECHVGLVLAGTHLLDQLKVVDSHLADRAVARQELIYFTAGSPEWLGVLKKFVDDCQGFELRLILNDGEPARLHVATGGSLRRLKCLLTEFVLVGVQQGKTALDGQVMATAFAAVYGTSGAVNPYAA